jgi:putative nucleotidyltransferase with HDIG domain
LKNLGNSSLKEDLKLTLRELSHTYEELTLIYRLAEMVSGGSVDEICESILNEVVEICEVSTAAILLVDKSKEHLYTKSSRGKWDKDRSFGKEVEFLWSTMEASSRICKFHHPESRQFFPDIDSMLVCPLIGKQKTIGALVIASERGKEFYSDKIKLLHAVTSHAALFIENAILYEEMGDFLLSIIGSYVKAIEASSGWTAGHTERVTGLTVGIGREMGLDPKTLERLRISGLLHDIGKITVSTVVLDKKEELMEEEWDEIKKHPRIGAEIIGKIKAFSDIAEAVRYHHEYWDGSGASGLKQGEIPLMARILSVADAFDAMTSERPYKPKIPTKDAIKEIVEHSGKQFDPEVVKAFIKWRG